MLPYLILHAVRHGVPSYFSDMCTGLTMWRPSPGWVPFPHTTSPRGHFWVDGDCLWLGRRL